MYNEKSILILQCNKSMEWEDITREVDWYKEDTHAYLVCYVHNDKTYYKSFKSWKVITSAKVIPFYNYIIYIKGKPANNIEYVVEFKDWYKVFFSNNITRIYSQKDIRFVRNIKQTENGRQVINYLKEISLLLSGSDTEQFLYKQLDELSIPENSILAKLLMNKLDKTEDTNPVIYPFATNLSQKEAVVHSLENDLSIIQGPPGTGKTQTILNIISNFLYRNQNVAVLSGNNEAVKNVYDKLAKEGYGCINAVLGRKDNVIDFFDNQPVNTIVQEKKNGDLKVLGETLKEISYINNECLSNELAIDRLQQQINELGIEKEINSAEYFVSTHNVPASLSRKKYTSRKLLELASFLEVLPKERITKFFNRMRMLFRFGILSVKGIASSLEESINYLKNKYYSQKIGELEEELQIKKDLLARCKAEDIAKQEMDISKQMLDAVLYRKYNRMRQRTYSASTYKREFDDFISQFPIVCSTTHSIRSCSRKEFVYDCVIIDESSQVDLVTAFIALSCAKRVVLVGDEKQLPHVVNSKLLDPMRKIFEKYNLASYLDYTKHNILSYINCAYPNVPKTLLNVHYRCDPQIIGFCNKRFYNGELVIHNSHQTGNGVTIIKHGSHLCRERTNERQVDIIEKEILPKEEDVEIGIIAPYRAQVDLLTQRLTDKNECIIDTVHKFQGKERDCIILSTVSNSVKFYDEEDKIDFLNNQNLINVAISRAKKRLYILSSEELVKQEGTIIKDLTKYYEYYCDETKVIKTNVYSVFDLMYDDYAPILEEMKNSLLKISSFESENIIATIIKEICDCGRYGSLGFEFNYPLKYVIKLDTIQDLEDRKFICNINTHCDFIIYSKLNKEILLEIEVDGAQHNEPIQVARDKRKDRLLATAGIKHLRLKTTNIECKEKIIQELIS